MNRGCFILIWGIRIIYIFQLKIIEVMGHHRLPMVAAEPAGAPGASQLASVAAAKIAASSHTALPGG